MTSAPPRLAVVARDRLREVGSKEPGKVDRKEPGKVDRNTVCVNPYRVVDSRALCSSDSTALLYSLNVLVAESFPKGGAERGTPLASNLHATMNLSCGAVLYGLGCTAGANGHPVAGPSVPTSCRSPVPAATRARSRFARTRSVSRLIASLVDFFIIV